MQSDDKLTMLNFPACQTEWHTVLGPSVINVGESPSDDVGTDHLVNLTLTVDDSDWATVFHKHILIRVLQCNAWC